MQYVLVPRYRAASSGAAGSLGCTQLWVAAFGDSAADDPSRAHAMLAAQGSEIALRDWTKVRTTESVWFASCDLPTASARQEFKLIVDSVERDSCVVEPLPQRLGPQPFRVLLGSCFDPGISRSERLKQMVDALEPMPALKILCGDQVYLDPTFPASLGSSSLPTEGERAAAIYRQVWTHPGFRGLLARGLNVFCPDDHDFWNDYTVEAGKSQLKRADAATELLRAFQCDQPVQEFNVAPLRFMVVDTRQKRTEPSATPAQFVDKEVLTSMVEWLGKGDGPGVLVLGQPIFGEEGYRTGKFGSDIPQYTDQFGELAKALLNAPCSVLVLSGDVHWGRVACGKNLKEKPLVEVISSPLELSFLRSLVGGVRRWRGPHRQLGSVDCQIETYKKYKVKTPHFTTLDFTAPAAGGNVDVRVKAWPLRKSLERRAEALNASFTL